MKNKDSREVVKEFGQKMEEANQKYSDSWENLKALLMKYKYIDFKDINKDLINEKMEQFQIDFNEFYPFLQFIIENNTKALTAVTTHVSLLERFEKAGARKIFKNYTKLNNKS